MLRRPCLVTGCPILSVPGRSRCADHEAARTRHRNHRRRSAPGNGAALRMRRLLDRQGFGLCAECRRPLPAAALEVDHAQALVLGGLDVDTNVRPLCRPCHRRKTREDTRVHLARRSG